LDTLINNIQTSHSIKRTPASLKRLALDSRMTDLTALDEKVEGRNLNVESKLEHLLQLVFLYISMLC